MKWKRGLQKPGDLSVMGKVKGSLVILCEKVNPGIESTG